MTLPQLLILGILVLTMGMFLWGRWRHDMVAAAGLLICVFTGLVSAGEAFAGFGHPAVVTVACVLILSRGLQTSGAVDALTRWVLPAKAGPMLTIAALTGLGALLSGFMNNVGALALLMPVAIQMSKRLELSPGRVLMPLAFGSILGGMTTMIGTPPNLIVASYRAETSGAAFRMFDFTPVGAAVAGIGVFFIALLGYRLVPKRQGSEEGFDTAAYMTEARVREGSKADGKTLREIEEVLEKAEAQVIALVRNEVRMHAPGSGRTVLAGDILIIEADAEALASALSDLGLDLEEAKEAEEKEDADEKTAKTAKSRQSDEAEQTDDDSEEEPEEKPDQEFVLMELALLPESGVLGRSAKDLLLRTRHGINLLAVSRQGKRSTSRLRSLKLKAGDVVLVQGPADAISAFASSAGCVPLAARELRIPDREKAITASLIMAIAVLVAAIGLLPAAVSFAAGALASMVFRTVPPRVAYEAVDWPVIVLLAALIPVAGAMESTGAAEVIAGGLLGIVAQGNTVIALALVIIVTMTLSDLMNNAATAAVMCPIAISIAQLLGVSADPFLMGVAIGASCAFLTPIGHQNNTLILGPGGFRFGDYWRLGLPMEIIVVVVSLPLLLMVWPL